jgi:hypothetical protein
VDQFWKRQSRLQRISIGCERGRLGGGGALGLGCRLPGCSGGAAATVVAADASAAVAAAASRNDHIKSTSLYIYAFKPHISSDSDADFDEFLEIEIRHCKF